MACKGTTVEVAEAVPVAGGMGVKVEGISVVGTGRLPVTGTTAGVDEAVIVGLRMIGVGLTIPGVREGIAVQTGNG